MSDFERELERIRNSSEDIENQAQPNDSEQIEKDFIFAKERRRSIFERLDPKMSSMMESLARATWDDKFELRKHVVSDDDILEKPEGIRGSFTDQIYTYASWESNREGIEGYEMDLWFTNSIYLDIHYRERISSKQWVLPKLVIKFRRLHGDSQRELYRLIGQGDLFPFGRVSETGPLRAVQEEDRLHDEVSTYEIDNDEDLKEMFKIAAHFGPFRFPISSRESAAELPGSEGIMEGPSS